MSRAGATAAAMIEGDCVEVMRGMADGCVDAIITDPPYNVVNRPSAGLRAFDKGVADAAPVDIEALAGEFVRLTRGVIYVWCGTEQVSAWRAAFVARGLTTRQCVWIKTNPAPTNGDKLWLSGVELCVYARKPRAPHFVHCKVPAWTGPTQRVTGFPCPKPVWLMRAQIEASVAPGGSVLDPFAGSGSTGVACAEAGVGFIGIEREPAFAELARRRIPGCA